MYSIIDQINQQLVLSSFIASAYDNFVKNEPSGITKQRIDSCLSSLAENWNRFSLTHGAIMLAVDKLKEEDKQLIRAHSYFTDQLFSMTYMDYITAVEQIKSSISTEQQDLTRSFSTPSRSQDISVPNVSQYQHTRLPRINIPKFDGTPSEWLNFRDLFAIFVLSNKSLTSVEKLQYLKTSLTGTAAYLIENTTLISENLPKAWDSLLSFYDNPRLQVNTVLQSLVNLKSMTKESAIELEHLYTTMHQLYRTLETFQRPVEAWDDFLVFMTVKKLDSDSVKAWENKLGSSKIPPSWKELNEFLITRLSSLQANEESRVGKIALKPQKATAKTHYQGKSGDNSSSNTSGCSICKGKHYIVRCPKYINETTAQKLALVTKHKLCYNCLGNHRISNCKVTKRCRKCGRKHHTTIHKEETSSITKDTKDVESKSQQQSNLTEAEQN
ncbi:uncharacterized protein [Temnothorax nylanderi]|uniref:uncharacterized protein n=1 Tax=Temnothorax nylanderi TaxID=102681 RepID=UPI003A89CEAB